MLLYFLKHLSSKKFQYGILSFDLYMRAGEGRLQLKPLLAQSTTLDFVQSELFLPPV